jgi:hypothetical protein
VVLALLVAALCHDLGDAGPKLTTADRDSATDKLEFESLRYHFRLLHEARGGVELVAAVSAAEMMLKEGGHNPIGLEALELAYQIVVNHDAPSRRTRNPFDPSGPVAHPYQTFVESDGICMIEHEAGITLACEVPIGPMVEPWTKRQNLDPQTVLEQLTKSEKSLRERLQAAFGLDPSVPLGRCFCTAALGELAEGYVARWRADLG